MKLIIVLAVCVAVASAHYVDSAMRHFSKRQDIPGLTCTADDLSRIFPTNCADEFATIGTNPDFANDPDAIRVLCDTGCLDPVLQFFDECLEGTDFGFDLPTLLREYCASNANGQRCADIQALTNQTTTVIGASCLSATGGIPDGNCSAACVTALENSNSLVDCCVNVANVTGLNQLPGLSTIVSYELWSGCGVQTPGFCSSAAAVRFSFMFAFLMMLIAALLA